MEELLTHASRIIDNTSEIFDIIPLGLTYRGTVTWFPELQQGGLFANTFDMNTTFVTYMNTDFYRWLKSNNYKYRNYGLFYNSATDNRYEA